MLLERSVPCILCDHHRTEFYRLEYESPSLFEYETNFYELSHYPISSIPTEFEQIHKLVKGLANYL